MQQTLFLMVGYPGSGKTTIAKMIHEHTNAVHLWADDERQKMFANPTLSETESKQLYDHMNQEVEKLLTTGNSVVFDANFNFFKDREHLRQIAAKAGADFKLLWLTTPKEISFNRACSSAPDLPTRIVFGDMTQESFDRVASKLESPTDAEHPITIDGQHVTPETLSAALHLGE